MVETGEITVLNKATSKSRSLRTTIPMGIVKQFNLSEGDKLNWEIRAESGELIIVNRCASNFLMVCFDYIFL